MKAKYEINHLIIMLVFFAVYPILPNYFRCWKFAVRDLLALACFALALFLEVRHRMATTGQNGLCGALRMERSRFSILGVIIIWAVITASVQMYHGELYNPATTVLLWCCVVPAFVLMIRTQDTFIKAIDTVISVASAVGIFGIIEEITHYNVFSLINTIQIKLNYNPLRFGLLRIISFTSHAITYSVYCMMILALIFYRLSFTKEKKRVYYMIAYGIVLVNAFLTLARSGFLFLVCSQIMLFCSSDYKAALKKIAGIMIVGGIGLGVACIFSSQARYIVKIAVYTVLAIFNDKYVSVLQQAGLIDNAQGIGNRLDLYGWVAETVKPDYLLGKGQNYKFSYTFTNKNGNIVIKDSIEVQYLRTFLRYGLVGMIAEICLYVRLLIGSLKRTAKIPAEWEGNISFSRLFFVILFNYILVLFCVMQNEDAQIFLVFVILFTAYIMNDGFRCKKSSKEEQPLGAR